MSDIKEAENAVFLALKNFNSAWISLLKPKTDEEKIIFNLSGGILHGLKASVILIMNDCVNEVYVVLRTAIEKTTLYIYMLHFPNYAKDYLIEGQLLWFKNCFLIYKSIIEAPQQFQNDVYAVAPTPLSKEGMVEDLNDTLKNKIHPKASEQIISVIGEESVSLSKDQIARLDKFFLNNKFLFMSIHEMWRRLENAGINLKNSTYDYTLSFKQALFREYNEYSQITHGRYQDLQRKSKEAETYRTMLRIAILVIQAGIDKNLVSRQDFWSNISEIKRGFELLDELGESEVLQESS